MADLELIVDSKDVVTAQTETTKLERNLKKLFDRYSKGAVTNGVYEKSLKQITQEYQNLGASSQKATGQVRKYVRDLQREKTATEQSRRAKEEAKEAQRRLNEETRKAKEAAKETARQERERADDLRRASKAMDQHEAEMESLRLKYDQTYRIQKQYEAGLEEIRMAHMAGALSAEQMEKEIKSLGLEFQKMQSGQKTWSNQFVQGSSLAAKSTNRFGYVAQQVGYQVGDFFVQMQSGTNVFVAFGQQATQLAGLLPGLAGAVVGIGISMGTALLAAWSRSREEAKESKDAYDRLSESLNNLDKYSVDLVKSNEKIKSSFESIIGVVQEINAKALKKSLSDVTEPFEEEVENLKIFMKERQELAKSMGADSSISSLEKGITIDVFGLDKYKEVVRVGELLKTIQGETREELAKSLNIVSQTLDKEGLRTEEVDAILAKYSESIGVNKIALSTFEDQKRELEDQLALKQKELEFGKDSVQVFNEELRQRKASLVAQIKKSNAAEEEKKQLLEIVPKLIEVESLTRTSADEADRLEEAFKRAAEAMSAMTSIGDNISKSIAVATSKVQALKSGADEAIASNIEAIRYDLDAERKKAIALGVDPVVANAQYAIEASQLDILKEKLAQVKALEDERRESNKATKPAAKSIEEAKKYLEEARSILQQMEKSAEIPVEGVEGYEKAVQDVIRAETTLYDLRQKQSEEVLKNFSEESQSLRDQLALNKEILKFGENSQEVINLRMEQRIKSYNRQIKAQVDQNKLTWHQGEYLKEVNAEIVKSEQELSSAKGATEGAVSATTRWANMMANVRAEVSGIMASLSKLGGSMIDTTAKAARIKVLQEGGSIREGIIAEGRSRFDAQLRKEAEGANIFEKGILKARKALFEFNIVQDEAIEKLEEKSKGTKYSSGGGSGSGDSGVKSFIDMFIGDEDTFQAKREKLDEWLQSTMDRYSEFNAAELEILRQHNINKLSIEEEFQQRLRQLQVSEKLQRLNEYSSLFNSLAQIASVGGKKTAKIVATFQAIEGTINAYGAAIKALNTPGISLPGRFAAYASVLAAGLKGVMAIKQAGGGGGGGVSIGGTTPITTPANTNAEPQRVYIEGLDADSLISGRMLSEIFDKFYKENEERGAVFLVKGV